MATNTTTALAQASEALRCRFTDLAGLYAQPGGSQHRIDSLWWWVKFVYDHSALRPTEGGSLKRVFSLSEGHKSNRAAWIKSKAYLFALAYKYTAHWRACAERQPQPQQQEGSADGQAAPVLVKPDPEDQLLAWLDLLLLIAWKHMSTQTAKSRKGWLAFPFVTLKRTTTDESDPGAAVFSDYEYLGLTTVEEADEWQLEWTEEGVAAFKHWSTREDEIKAMSSLRRRLIDDRTEADLADARKALDAAVGRGRQTRQSRATVIDLTAETVVKLSAEVGALREELSKLLAETKKQKKKRLRVKKEKKEKKKENKKRKKEKKAKEDEEETSESDDDSSDDDEDDDDDESEEIEDEGDDQSQTTLSGKRKRHEEEKNENEKEKKSKKKKKKSNNKKKAKRRTDGGDEVSD